MSIYLSLKLALDVLHIALLAGAYVTGLSVRTAFDRFLDGWDRAVSTASGRPNERPDRR